MSLTPVLHAQVDPVIDDMYSVPVVCSTAIVVPINGKASAVEVPVGNCSSCHVSINGTDGIVPDTPCLITKATAIHSSDPLGLNVTEVLVVEELVSTNLANVREFNREVKLVPGVMVSYVVGLALLLVVATVASMAINTTRSPDVGAALRVNVSGEPVAVVSSVPVPPIEDVLQLAISNSHPPMEVIGGELSVDDPVYASVTLFAPAVSPST